MSESSMRAVITDPSLPGRVRLGERTLRNARPEEAVVKVSHFSLNRGELQFAAGRPAGSAIGWDVAGVVDQSAADGGPKAGTPVVAFVRAQEGWAERVNVPLNDLCKIPDGMTPAVAAALPVAGCTALGVLDRAHRLLGQRALVTGVTGGVGAFGVQLARAGGAIVVAQVRKPEQTEIAKKLGADEVVVTSDGQGLEAHGRFGFVMDGIGGDLLVSAIQQLTADGVAVTYGVTGDANLQLPLGALMGKGRTALSGFNLYAESAVEPLSRLLERLTALVSSGRVTLEPTQVEPWTKVSKVAEAFLLRKITGKLVLQID